MEIMSALLGVIERETALARAGKLREAMALEPSKTDFSRRYVAAVGQFKASQKYLSQTAPELLTTLHRHHDAFRAMLQVNLTVLATAHAVSESIVRGVNSEMQRLGNIPNTFRCAVYAGVFLAMMGALGDTTSWWALVALPCATLLGAAFSATGFAATCFMRSWTDFDKITLVSVPLFLFSATFYPLSELPRWLQVVVEALPLYPGVDLCRQLSLGHPSVGALGDVVYLLALGLVALEIGRRRVTRLLAP